MSDTPAVLRGGEDEGEDNTPYESPEDWMVPARQDGVEWGDLAAHIALASDSASRDGHLEEDIDRHLGFKGTRNLEDRAGQQYADEKANDPAVEQKLAGGSWNPFSSDFWRGHYVEALKSGEAKNPRDYADAMGAGVLQEAHTGDGLKADEQTADMRKRGVAAAADALAEQLPHREDFIDASLQLVTQDADEATRKRVQDNLMRHYAETGEKPLDAVKNESNPRSQWYEPFTHAVEHSLLPGFAGLAAIAPGAAAGAAVGAVGGPIGIAVGGLLGGLVGAGLATFATGAAQDKVLEWTGADKALGLDAETRRREAEQHPYMAFAGELAGSMAGMSPFAVGRAIATRVTNSAIMSGMEGYNEYATDGKFDPLKLAMAGGVGALLPGVNFVGKQVEALGVRMTANVTGRPVTHLIMPDGIKELPVEHPEASHYDQLHDFAQRIATDQSGEFKMPDWVQEEDVKHLSALRAKEFLVDGNRIADPIDAFHASPNLFNRFEPGHLGEGEASVRGTMSDRNAGNIHTINYQGNGFYFSTNVHVHEGYLSGLAKYDPNNPEHVAAHFLQMTGSREAAIKQAEFQIGKGVDKEFTEKALAVLKSDAPLEQNQHSAHDYRVQLHVNKDELLHLDLPIHDQSDYIKQKLGIPEHPGGGYDPVLGEARMRDELFATADPEARAKKQKEFSDQIKEYNEKMADAGWGKGETSMTGDDYFKKLTNKYISKETPNGSTKYATDELAAKGVKGTRYIDGEFRGDFHAEGGDVNSYAHNYVMFHDTSIDMLGRDGATMLPDHYKPILEELAQAYHSSGKIVDAFKAMAQVFGNTEGSLKLPGKPPAVAAEDAKYKRGNLWFDLAWNRGLGERVQAPLNAMKRAIEPFWKDVNPLVKEFEDEMKPGGSPMNTPLGQWYRWMEGASTGAVPPPNRALQAIGGVIRTLNDSLKQSYIDLEAKGLLTPKQWFDDYFVHIWADPTKASDVFNGLGLLGNQASFKERIHPTIEAGLAAGLKLKFPNPLQAQLVASSRALLLVNRLNIVGEMKAAGWASDQRLPNTTLLRGLSGNVWAHDSVASMWNSQVHPGMFHTDTSQGWYQTVLHAANSSKAVQLIAPTVHMMQEALATVTSGISMTLEGAERLQMTTAMRGLTHVVPGVGAADTWNLGRRARNAYESGQPSPFMQKYGADLKLLEGSNFTALTEGRSITEEVSRNPNLWESFTRNFGGDTAGERFGNLGRAIWDEQMKKLAYDWNGGKDYEGLGAKLFMMPLRVVGHLGDIFGRVIQTLTEPVFGTGKVLGVRGAIIPNIKLGTALMRMHSWRMANLGASEEAANLQAAQIRMSTDNRFGELNQDTVFMNKAVKQAANMAMISPGWKWGTWSNLFAAFGRNINAGRTEMNPTAMHDILATAAAWGIVGSLWQYFHTGTTALDTDTPLRDYLAFRANADGSQRGMQFGEPKELYDMAKVVMSSLAHPFSMPSHMFEYALSATNPLAQATYTLTAGGGVDMIGHRINNYPGGPQRYFTDHFSPIIHNIDKNLKPEEETGLTNWEQTWLGNRPAPSYAGNPDKFFKDQEGLNQKWDKAELSRARKEASHLQNREWLDEYIKAKEEAMANGHAYGGAGVTAHRKSNYRQQRRRAF